MILSRSALPSQPPSCPDKRCTRLLKKCIFWCLWLVVSLSCHSRFVFFSWYNSFHSKSKKPPEEKMCEFSKIDLKTSLWVKTGWRRGTEDGLNDRFAKSPSVGIILKKMSLQKDEKNWCWETEMISYNHRNCHSVLNLHLCIYERWTLSEIEPSLWVAAVQQRAFSYLSLCQGWLCRYYFPTTLCLLVTARMAFSVW